jgi:hypothetical protein
VAAHYLRFQEVYGDAFLEAISSMLHLGTYDTFSHKELLEGPFRGYHNLVLLDGTGLRLNEPESYADALRNFRMLKLSDLDRENAEISFDTIEDLPEEQERFVIRGTECLSQEMW